MRAPVHYLLTAAIMPVYGIQVCPFLESLKIWQVAVPIFAALGAQFALRQMLLPGLVGSAELKNQTLRVFLLDMGLFLITAIVLMIYNGLHHNFPMASGLKVLVGFAGLGFFVAIDLALKQERAVIAHVTSSGQHLIPDKNYMPIKHKVSLFATSLSALLVGVFMLLVIKDLDWIVEVGETIPLEQARISIIKEFLFILAVVLPYTLNCIHSFARNLNLFLEAEKKVLDHVSSGDYSLRVPVSSNDEFGLIARDTNEMVERIQARTEELNLTQDVTILSLATLAEARDNETGAHILRTQRYVWVLADELKDLPHLSETLTNEVIELLFKSAPLHDIGKVGIPDHILLKPGKLTAEEFEIMKGHVNIGAEALSVAERELGDSSFLRLAREIALTHHEKWDGSGYPQGLRGDAIPVSGRLMAVADVYDALISKRVYKPALSHEEAMAILRDGEGSHFDPDVIKALLARERDFRDIARTYADDGNP
ncbi:MAG: HD domain-containing protein [Rhodospirillales bacterium]|nr:HD domain-containing protein [Rhodospirillales bacterium]